MKDDARRERAMWVVTAEKEEEENLRATGNQTVVVAAIWVIKI